MKRICLKPYRYLLLASCLLFCDAKCLKDKIDGDGLPVLTHEGKNTFGFLLNGQPWTPRGFSGTSNLGVWYDPNDTGGSFNMGAYRQENNVPGTRTVIHIFGSYINGPVKIMLPDSRIGFSFSDQKINCDYTSSNPTITLVGGYFDLQKLDLQNRIFAGEFELIFKGDTCQQISATKGRFDLKL